MKTPLKFPALALSGVALAVLAVFALALSVSPLPAQAHYDINEKYSPSAAALVSSPDHPATYDVLSTSASKPARPTNVAAATSDTAITLTWEDPGDSSITGYQIQRRIVAKGERLSVIEENTGTSVTRYEDTDVTPNTKYAYRIRAINSAGTSRPSTNIEVKYLIDESIPQNLTAESRHYRMYLNWDAPSYSGVTGYKVLRKLHSDRDGEFEVIRTHTSSDPTKYTDFGVNPNKRYVYRVKAVIPGGLSNPSNLADERTPRLLRVDQRFTPPLHMNNVMWFGPDEFWPGRASASGADAIEVDFTIHNAIVIDDDAPSHGMFFMILTEQIAGINFYLGLQIDNKEDPAGVGHGKRLIFSRWGTRDLDNVRLPEENSWSQSAGHEGEFVGTRVAYDWGAGDYNLRLAAENREDSEGRWFGVWITDKSSGETTWGGSLRFPYIDGESRIDITNLGSIVEIYGSGSITPAEIPTWHISMEKPKFTRDTSIHRPSQAISYYTHMRNGTPIAVPNSDIEYDAANGEMHFRVGGETERKTREGYINLR